MLQVARTTMSPRITVRDVAAAARVHFTTAARALKNDPRISAETCARVKDAARQLGYMPDPMMSAFAAYRQKDQIPKFRGTIAWVTNFPKRHDWHNLASDRYYDGAVQQAAELGYQLEEFWLHEPKMTAKRASQILFSRGIRGLLLAPQPHNRGHLSLRWEDFSVVSFGYSMVRPKVHLVAPAHFRAVVTCFRQLRALGHRKIGFYCEHSKDERNDRLWSSAFLSERELLPESREIPLLMPKVYAAPPLLQWYRRYRPTAIITTYQGSGPLKWLRDAKCRIPQEVSIAFLNTEQTSLNVAGINEHSAQIGIAAVNLLAGMLQRGERGLPEAPLRVLVEGVWADAPTVRSLQAGD